MNDTWLLAHSVDVAAPLAFVWAWRSDLSTWHDPPARFEIDGSFADGATGRTILPGQPPFKWTLRDVRAPAGFTVEMPFEGAEALFEWRFEAIDEHRTRLTQRIGVRGDGASMYEEQIRAGFAPTLSEGMARLAEALERAARLAP
jgi:hypothetical protein